MDRQILYFISDFLALKGTKDEPDQVQGSEPAGSMRRLTRRQLQVTHVAMCTVMPVPFDD